jgi:hypothetical protein
MSFETTISKISALEQDAYGKNIVGGGGLGGLLIITKSKVHMNMRQYRLSVQPTKEKQ